MILQETKHVLCQLIQGLGQMDYDQYTHKGRMLFGSTIGGHTRHIVELYRQLLVGYDAGVVDYDKRQRSLQLELSLDDAMEGIASIVSDIDRPDKQLYLCTHYGPVERRVESTYFRELIYNMEHCIHHQAIMKIACEDYGGAQLDRNFGVAKSTIEFRLKCAQ